MNTPCDWRGLLNVQCDEVMEHRVVWWRWVGAVPMCPPASSCKGASIVQFPAHNACVFGMERLLRERSGGHTGTAPTVSFGWIVRKWLFCLYGIAWKNITERGRGGAYVPARVVLQGRIHRSIHRAQCMCFWHGNAATRTFGRARRNCPYAFCLRELCVDVRPYGFVWVDYVWDG